MKQFISLSSILLLFVISFSSCSGNKEFKKDVAGISDAMCRIIDVQTKRKNVNPTDSETVQKLNMELNNIQTEMTILYTEFRQKYGDKLKDDKFKKAFAKELSKTMLNCPHLSKEDREKFEKETD